MNDMCNRIILVSDMHYTISTESEKYPVEYNVSAAGSAFGYTLKEKIDFITNDIRNEYEKAGVNAVLILGDLSIDDYGFRKLPLNYCLKFKNDCMAMCVI